MTLFSQTFKQFQIPRIVALLLLVILLAIGAAPGYLKGSWPWTQAPKVHTLKALRQVRQSGLELPGWQVANHQTLPIGEYKWLVQELESRTAATTPAQPTSAVLLMLLQQSQTHQPQVEWMDLKGSQRWKTDSFQLQRFTTQAPDATVAAQFFRAWNDRQTFAVLQWYAWPGAGNPSPDRWFWADQSAQLQQRRLPWAAVSLLLPIEPLGDINPVWPIAESLGKTIQSTLMAGPLQSPPATPRA